jgi:hypothetical protein
MQEVAPTPSACRPIVGHRSADYGPGRWLEGRNRFVVLDELWGLLARADGALDLLLYSERECEERRLWRTHVIGRAFPGGAVAGWCSLSRKYC